MVKLVAVALMSVIAMIFSATMLMTSASDTHEAAAAAKVAGKREVQDSERNYYASDRTVLKRENGQFYLNGQVNGTDTRFLVDTGADLVALTLDDAEQLGINVNPGDFQPITQTASGVGYGEEVTIESMEIGGKQFSNVEAVVIEGLGVNLLGQSVLRQLGKIELHGEQLVINH